MYVQISNIFPIPSASFVMSFLGIGLNMPGGYGVDATFFFSLLVGCAASLPKEKSSVNPIAPWHIQSYTQERHHRPVLETTGYIIAMNRLRWFHTIHISIYNTAGVSSK
jgi:hypothetical protein